MTCTNNPVQDLKQLFKVYEHTKAERDKLEIIIHETIYYLVKQIGMYERDNCEREVKVLNDVINKMQDIEKEKI